MGQNRRSRRQEKRVGTRKGWARGKQQFFVESLESRQLLTVNSPTGQAITAVEGVSDNFLVAKFSTTTPLDTFTATITWGDFTASSGTILADPSPGVFDVFGTHTYAEETLAPLATSTFIQDTTDATSGTAIGSATVQDAPLSGSGTPFTATEGTAFSGQVATFTDGNPTAPVSDFTASINWGDGSTTTGTVTQPGGVGTQFVVSGTHTYPDEGSFTATTTVHDVGGQQVAVMSGATVNEADVLAPVSAGLTTPEGTAFNGLVATFNNTGFPNNLAADFTASINWGDGTVTGGTVGGGSGAPLTVSGTHTYADEGNFPLNVILSDNAPGTATATATDTAIVTENDVLIPGPVTISAPEGTAFNGPVATFTDFNGANVPADFAATINWGDGTTTAGTVTGGSGAFTVSGTHTYRDEGSFSATVTLTDDDPGIATATASGTATVAEADSLVPILAGVIATEGTAVNGPVALFGNLGFPTNPPSDFVATIVWGDSTVTGGTVSSVVPGTLIVSGTHTYADEGSFSLSVTLSDDAPGTATATATGTATVSEADVLTPLPVTITPVEGNSFSGVVGNFTDTFTGNVATDFTASIDWGDGTTTPGTVSGGGANYSVSGTHTYVDEGTFNMHVTLTDDAPGTATATADSTANVQDAPINGSASNFNAVEGVPTGNFVIATFTDGNPLATTADFTATVFWGDGSTSAGSVSGPTGGPFSVTANHTYHEEGTYSFFVLIQDDGGNSTSPGATASVADAPLTATGTPIFGTEGAPLTNVQVATFLDADQFGTATDYVVTITWGDGATSAGQVLEDAAGTFHVLGSHTYVDNGVYTTNVTIVDNGDGRSVNDETNSRATASSTATIVESPLLPVAGAPVGTEGLALPATTIVATFTDTGGADPVGDYTASIDWGDGTTSPGTVVVNGVNFAVQGGHTYAEEGIYPLVVTINDNDGAASTTAFATGTSTINDAVLTPLTPPAIAGAIEGTSFGISQIAFDDTNPAATVGDFTALIVWGDGTTSLGTVTQPLGVGTDFFVNGSHTYTEEGTYTVTYLITDDGGSTTSTSTTATVTDAALTNATGLNISPTEGSNGNFDVATFTDTNPFGTVSDFTATITWGDGTTSAGVVTLVGGNASGALFRVSGSHDYHEEGVFPIHVAITDVGGSTAATDSTATVGDAPLSGSGVPVTGTEGAVITNALVASFHDSNPFGVASDFTASIVWGDGLTTSGTVVANGSGFNVLGSHTYTEEGAYAIAVTITDDGGSTLTVGSQATIADAALTSTPSAPITGAIEGQPLTSVVVSQFTDPNLSGTLSDFTATIDWGDGTASSPGVVAFVSVTPGGVIYSVAGSHTYAEERLTPYTITITVHDVGGAQTTTTNTATVGDAPLINPTPSPVQAVESLNPGNFILGTFTDTNPGGTVSDFLVTITWGDGTTTTGGVSEIGGSAAGALFQVFGSHVFPEEGSFPIHVNIADVGGQTTSFDTTATITEAPVLLQAFTVVGTEGKAINNALVGSFVDLGGVDPNEVFSATIDWGDGTTSGGTISPLGASFAVFGSHTYVEEGTYQLTVTVTSGSPGTGTAEAEASNDADIADAKLTGSPFTPINVQEGTPVTGVIAKFTDANPLATLDDFTATINWGDGIITDGTVVVDAGGGFDVTGTHTYEEGVYPVSVSIVDVGGSTAHVAGTATVTDAPLTTTGIDVTAVEGKPFAGLVASFTDANPLATVSDFTATIVWGDGHTSVGTISEDASKTFFVGGSNTYDEEGSFPIAVTIKDVGGEMEDADSTATVSDAPLSATAVKVSAVEGKSFTGPVATFTDADPNGTITDYTATIDWGDGTTSSGTVSANGAGFLVTGTHTYAEEGVDKYLVTVTIQDVGGSSVSSFGHATVADSPPTASPINFTVIEGHQFSGPVAAFSEIWGTPPIPEPGSDFKAFIDWGDGSPITQGTIVDLPGGQRVDGIHTYKDADVNGGSGHFNVTVTIIDDGGAFVRVVSTATVVDVPIALSGVLNPASDSGQSHFDAITNVKQPNFIGYSEAKSVVQLYAMPFAGGPLFPIGSTTADTSGFWSVTSIPLADGAYRVFATAFDKTGHTSAATQILPNVGGPLVIDSVGPTITNVVFNRLSGEFDFTFKDERSGMNIRTLVDANNYQLTKVHTLPGTYLFTSLTPTLSTNPTVPVPVAAVVNFGQPLKGGNYTLSIFSESVLKKTGIQDVAGNALDGEFYGFFPSGNKTPGGDFVALIDAIHNKIFPPNPVQGFATPNIPPGTRPGTTFLNATSTQSPALVPVTASNVHDLAIQDISVPTKKNQRP